MSILNVTFYGAVGNGTHDDTAGINATFTAAVAAKSSVYFPAGTYIVTETIQIPSGYMGLVFGDGPDSSFVYAKFSATIVQAKKPVFFAPGFVQFRDMAVYGGRANLGTSFNTPWFGIVYHGIYGAAWDTHLDNVDIQCCVVPMSGAASAISYKTSGTHGFEIDPVSGGTSFATDFAQSTWRNVNLWAFVQEFYDGTLNIVTAKDNHNNLVLPQTCAFETGGQQSVNLTFVGGTQANGHADAKGTVLLSNAGDLQYIGTMLTAPPASAGHTYSFYENTASGGSDLYLNHCYCIGGIANSTTSQGIISGRDINGEQQAPYAYGGNVQVWNVSGTDLRLDGVDVARGTIPIV